MFELLEWSVFSAAMRWGGGGGHLRPPTLTTTPTLFSKYAFLVSIIRSKGVLGSPL